MHSPRLLSMTLVGGLIFLAISRQAAQAQNSDYDGLWAATIQCGPQLQNKRPAFTNRTEFKLMRGHLQDTKSQVQIGVREETQWEGRIDLRQMTLDGQARRENGASWTYQFSGTPTADRFTLNGSMVAQGQKIRDCTIEMMMTEPAPESLAARLRAPALQPVPLEGSVAKVSIAPAISALPLPDAPAGGKRVESRAGTTYVTEARPATRPAMSSVGTVANIAPADPTTSAALAAPARSKRSTEEAARLIAQGSEAYDRKDYAAALKIYSLLADEGNALAQTRVGLLYEFGDGVRTNGGTACSWYRKSALQGDPEGMGRLGDCYKYGSGVKSDIKQAVDWYTRSAAQGYPSANYSLAALYEAGDGVPRNIGKALELFVIAANAGYEVALLHLGRLYGEGVLVARDDAKAFGWYDKAARQGSDEGQNHLAEMYALGRGVAQSNAQAVVWWRKAAEQGYRPAQNQLGLMYDQGKGVAKDPVQAVSWYRKAAEQGEASAMYNLGTMYECGNGLAKDITVARSWYLKAAKEDDPDGLRAAVRLDQAARHAAMPGLRDGSRPVSGPCVP